MISNGNNNDTDTVDISSNTDDSTVVDVDNNDQSGDETEDMSNSSTEENSEDSTEAEDVLVSDDSDAVEEGSENPRVRNNQNDRADNSSTEENDNSSNVSTPAEENDDSSSTTDNDNPNETPDDSLTEDESEDDQQRPNNGNNNGGSNNGNNNGGSNNGNNGGTNPPTPQPSLAISQVKQANNLNINAVVNVNSADRSNEYTWRYIVLNQGTSCNLNAFSGTPGSGQSLTISLAQREDHRSGKNICFEATKSGESIYKHSAIAINSNFPLINNIAIAQVFNSDNSLVITASSSGNSGGTWQHLVVSSANGCTLDIFNSGSPTSGNSKTIIQPNLNTFTSQYICFRLDANNTYGIKAEAINTTAPTRPTTPFSLVDTTSEVEQYNQQYNDNVQAYFHIYGPNTENADLHDEHFSIVLIDKSATCAIGLFTGAGVQSGRTITITPSSKNKKICFKVSIDGQSAVYTANVQSQLFNAKINSQERNVSINNNFRQQYIGWVSNAGTTDHHGGITTTLVHCSTDHNAASHIVEFIKDEMNPNCKITFRHNGVKSKTIGVIIRR